MTFFDTVKGTVNTAADTISNVTQNIVEKNRTNAKLNRLRLIMQRKARAFLKNSRKSFLK